MSDDSRTPRNQMILYVVVGVVFLLLAGIALASFHSARESQRAQEKAAQLTTELGAAGLRTPTTDQIVQVLGDDGGAVCADPGNSLRRGVLYGLITNGAAGPGQRPIIADKRIVQGQLLIMKVYCPQ